MKAKERRCSRCGRTITSASMFCPICGHAMRRAPVHDSEITRPIAFIQFLFLGIPCSLIGLVSIAVVGTPTMRFGHSHTWSGFVVLGILAWLIFGVLSWELYQELRRRL